VKTSRRIILAAFGAYSLAAIGCNDSPGKPGPEPEVPRPDQVLDFATLYKTNCVACHGDSQHPGAAISITNPVLLAVIGEDKIKSILNQGVPGKLMPAFGQSGGGMLTEQQVGILASGLITNYGKPGLLDGQNPPPFQATLHPDTAAGEKAYATYCASCHGANGEGNPEIKEGSIVEAQYLGLISDQELRSFVIAGAPGMPDWRSDVAGHPMTDQEVTDVVAWLASHRPPAAPVTSPPVPETEPDKNHPLAKKVQHEPSSIR
jgi:cytochrome c oxidase cbb3-type subunit 3/ubiquinol-cytochrome c reductase cytochrome c subunit